MSPFSTKTNPYSGWVYDHPERLLAEPEAADLKKRLAGFLVSLNDKNREKARLVFDLGCGSGNFLIEQALRNPETAYVGFELRFKRLVKSAEKAEKNGLENVWFIRERAEEFARYARPGSLDRVHVNFPDPWPKRGQWKKRLVNAAFLENLIELLKPGGMFFLKTDHSGYFLHVLEQVYALKNLKRVGFSNDLHRYGAMEPNVRTEFEMLFRSKQKPVYFLALEKTASGRSTG